MAQGFVYLPSCTELTGFSPQLHRALPVKTVSAFQADGMEFGVAGANPQKKWDRFILLKPPRM